MANEKISQLDPASALSGGEEVPVVQSGLTVQTTTRAIANLAAPTELLGASLVSGNITASGAGIGAYAGASADPTHFTAGGTDTQAGGIVVTVAPGGASYTYFAGG